MKKSMEERGKEFEVSLINQEIDFDVDYVVQSERPKLRLVVNNERRKEPDQWS